MRKNFWAKLTEQSLAAEEAAKLTPPVLAPVPPRPQVIPKVYGTQPVPVQHPETSPVPSDVCTEDLDDLGPSVGAPEEPPEVDSTVQEAIDGLRLVIQVLESSENHMDLYDEVEQLKMALWNIKKLLR